MATDIKFCGLTRPDDAREAVALGAAYVGAIFADSPRCVDHEGARLVFAASGAARRVGVFGPASPRNIADTANALSLNVVQLHGEPDAAALADLRRRFSGQVWIVIRTEGALPPDAPERFALGDGVVIDARVEGQLGGTGVTVDWDRLASSLEGVRRPDGTLVLAGGLTPENVARAVAVVHPDVVDVSSGVERAPGIKDHGRMRAFARAVGSAGAGPA